MIEQLWLFFFGIDNFNHIAPTFLGHNANLINVSLPSSDLNTKLETA